MAAVDRVECSVRAAPASVDEWLEVARGGDALKGWMCAGAGTAPTMEAALADGGANLGQGPDDLPMLSVYFVSALCAAYIVGKVVLTQVFKALGTDGSSYLFRGVVSLHNLVLAVYSAWTFRNFAPLVLHSLQTYGFSATYCDAHGQLWDNGLAMLAYLFYLSKFYEFLDTLVLIVKNKPVSVLQAYHHVGAAFTMWGLVVTRTPLVLVFVLLNSALHTVMYTYFFLSSLSLGWIMAWAKPVITQVQMLQFVSGIVLGGWAAFPFLLWGQTAPAVIDPALAPTCLTEPQHYANAATVLYLLPLLILFLNFYYQSYIRPTKKASASSSAAPNAKKDN